MSKSNQHGESKDETTAIPQALPSSNVARPSISDTSGITAQTNQDYPLMPNSQSPTSEAAMEKSRIITALAKALGTLVFWRKVELGDGQEVYALCFPVRKWEIDPVSKELKPR
jgi:hypothetical protein